MTRAPIQVLLSDGKVYDFHALTLGPLSEAWPHILAAGEAAGDPKRLPEMWASASQAVLIALNASGRSLTIEDLRERLLDPETVQAAFLAVLEVSGIKMGRVPKAPALVKPSPSIGPESSSTSPAPTDGDSITSAAA